MCLSYSKGQRLSYSPGLGKPRGFVGVLYSGDVSEMEQYHLPSFLLVFSHFPATNKLGPSGADSWVGSRTLWVSPVNSPVRLGASPAISTPTGFFSQRFWGFISLHWNLGLQGLSCSPVVPPSFLAHKHGTTTLPDAALPAPVLQLPPCCKSSPPWLPILTPPTVLGECFFLNSLVIRLPYNSIFWQFWLFLFLNLLLFFFWFCEEAKYTYLCLYLATHSLYLYWVIFW